MKKDGFTLVELLITISIISVLTAIGTIVFSGVQKDGRDTKRKADLAVIQSALEQYRADQGSYPDTLAAPMQSSGKVYLSAIPTDPQSINAYCYIRESGVKYSLYSRLENPRDTENVVSIGNLLRNPSFEIWSNGTGGGPIDHSKYYMPDSWIKNSAAAHTFSSTNYQSGTLSIGVGGEVLIHQDISVKRSTEYVFEGWVASYRLYWRKNYGDATERNWVVAQLCSQTPAGEDSSCTPTYDSNDVNEWVKITHQFNTGSANTIRLSAHVRNKNETYWDSFSLNQVIGGVVCQGEVCNGKCYNYKVSSP